MSSGLAVLGLIAVGGLGTAGLLLRVRYLDQVRRDRSRHWYVVRWPRSVTVDQVSAFLRTLVGLATPQLGTHGRDTAVMEVIGTRNGLEHHLALPSGSAAYFIAQLRAAVPGVSVLPLDPDKVGTIGAARELRLTNKVLPLSVADPAAVSRTVLAAGTDLHRGEATRWQIVITGGAPQPRQRAAGSWIAALIEQLRGSQPEDAAHE